METTEINDFMFSEGDDNPPKFYLLKVLDNEFHLFKWSRLFNHFQYNKKVLSVDILVYNKTRLPERVMNECLIKHRLWSKSELSCKKRNTSLSIEHRV